MIDPAPLWDFEDPVASETRFRSAAEEADPGDRLVLMTQVARALGLQERYAEGHAVLDDLSPSGDVAAVLIALERGRLLRSSGAPAEARPLFEAAARSASEAGLDVLHVDALHMVALVSEPAHQLALGEEALRVARGSSDQRARDWDASLLNNIGIAHADAGDFEAALGSFEEALAARERIGDPARTRVARWMVAWALRNLGRHEEALGIQRALKAELDAADLSDPYVDEELALLEE
ncbi:tetratricopeptide repeat protein [Nocardioides sp. MAHUQ-72]|uniref:tetratricopeptide repeat protein n=1 Tax=unclassified Nocardioides TaxID=2615069 RepID=UPI0036074517